MTDINRIGTWIRRFLVEHLTGERNLAKNTQASYRDTLSLLLPFAAKKMGKPVDRLSVEDVSVEVVRLLLQHIEQVRGCSVATRNQRLAAIHALAHFISERSPEHIAWSSEIRLVPFKKAPKPAMAYLDKSEMEALLHAPDRRNAQGLRDYAVLLFLYNTGARADEVARLTISNLNLDRSPSVKITGKGAKIRYCPLWGLTAKALHFLVVGRAPDEAVFLSRRQESFTRFGVRTLVQRYLHKASRQAPSLAAKRISTHTIRHTTAMHLLRAGVDINTIRAWLGHVSLNTTNVYAEADLEMKAKALACCEIPAIGETVKLWRDCRGTMAFLNSL